MRLRSRATTLRKSSDQCRDTPRICRCPHKRSCCYFLRLEVGLASLISKPQSQSNYTLAHRFFQVEQAEVDDSAISILALLTQLAVPHRSSRSRPRRAMGPDSAAEISGLQQFRCSCLQNGVHPSRWTGGRCEIDLFWPGLVRRGPWRATGRSTWHSSARLRRSS